jgi:hypothetical protein
MVILYSGAAATHRWHRDTLAAIGGTATYLGADPGRAAAFDVSLLDLFWTTVSGYVHALALARSQGIAGRDLAPHAQEIIALTTDLIPEFAEHADRREYPGEDATLARPPPEWTALDHDTLDEQASAVHGQSGVTVGHRDLRLVKAS